MNHIDFKYINLLSPRLDRFAWKKTGLASCRCPVCGDSKKNKTKTRFFFYEKKGGVFVKCHNCDYGTTLGKFIEFMDGYAYKQYSMEKYSDGLTGRNEKRTPESLLTTTRTPKRRIVELPTLSSLSEDHPAVCFVRDRMIPAKKWNRLYYAEDFSEFAKTIDPEVDVGSDPRLVMPMIRNGELEGATGRILEKTGLRYILVKKDPEQTRMWFGLDAIDPDEPVYITEGSLDSLFLDNAVAMNGLGSVEIPSEIDNPVFVLDNEPRNRELVRTMERLVEQGHKVFVPPSSISQKDLNEMVLSGIDSSKLKRLVDENTVSGMSARLRLSEWRRC